MTDPAHECLKSSIRIAAFALCLMLVSSCATTRTQENVYQESAPSVDEAASIKKLIASLEPYSYHEASIESTEQWLRNVVIERVAFKGTVCDSVLYPGDGCAGKTRFFLDRTTQRFWQQYYAWEPGTSDTLTEYEVVNGRLAFVSKEVTSPPIPIQ